MTVRTVSLVTGASRGIGAAIARALGRRGGAVAVHYGTHREEADAVCAEIRAEGGEAMALQADMGNEAQIVTMFEKVDAAFGPLDCLVNNAGGIIAVKPRAGGQSGWPHLLLPRSRTAHVDRAWWPWRRHPQHILHGCRSRRAAP
jgi:NAD(P)-dependent dehydrogenase (short-subunit alcohol dehydrogenase family)